MQPQPAWREGRALLPEKYGAQKDALVTPASQLRNGVREMQAQYSTFWLTKELIDFLQ